MFNSNVFLGNFHPGGFCLLHKETPLLFSKNAIQQKLRNIELKSKIGEVIRDVTVSH